MSQNKHNILFPIETINRELDSRLFLAGMFVNPSRRIVLGNMHRLNRLLDGLDCGLYLGKHIFYRKSDPLRFYRQLKQRNIKLVYLQEEGAIFAGGEEEWHVELDRQYDTDLKWLTPEDWICNWGDFQNKHYQQKMPAHGGRTVATGHPRFDLYKPKYRSFYEADVRALQDRYGRYVLLNTNLAFANNSRGLKDTFGPHYGYLSADPLKRLGLVEWWAHHTRVLAGMVTLMHRISVTHPDINIVVRPHPSEDLGFYQTVLGNVPNIHVIHSGPVGPWIMGAEALIHDGCTTAVEAYFCETPIINYKSIVNRDLDLVIPDELGLQCKSQDQVLEALSLVLNGQAKFNVGNPSPLACQMLGNFREESFIPLTGVMEQALSEVGPPVSRASLATIIAKERYYQLREWPKRVASPMSRRKALHAASKQKFYGFDKETIERKVAAIGKILQRQLKTYVISDQLMVVETN